MARDGKENRRFERMRWRVPCTFLCHDAERRGFVTDLSASGLFVHSTATLEPGATIVLTLDTDEYPPMTICGVVARSKNTNRNAIVVEQGGMGIQLDTAPEEYYQLVASLTQKSS